MYWLANHFPIIIICIVIVCYIVYIGKTYISFNGGGNESDKSSNIGSNKKQG